MPLSMEFSSSSGVTKLSSTLTSGKVAPRFELSTMRVSYSAQFLNSSCANGKVIIIIFCYIGFNQVYIIALNLQASGTAVLALKNNVSDEAVLLDVSSFYNPCAKDGKPVWTVNGTANTGVITAEGVAFGNLDVSLSQGNIFLHLSFNKQLTHPQLLVLSRGLVK